MYSEDSWPGRSGESLAVGEVENEVAARSVGDWRVGLWDGAWSGFFGRRDRGGECSTSD